MNAAIRKLDSDTGDVVYEGPHRYLVHFVEFHDAASCERLSVEGISVFNRLERFADIYVLADDKTEDRLKALRALPGYVWDEFSTDAFAPPARVGERDGVRAVPEEIVHGGFGKYTGAGTIIAVLDTGLDFRNADFVTFDAQGKPTSRLRYFWDTVDDNYTKGRFGHPSPISYPNGTSIGTLYTHDDLNQELRSFRALIPVWDIDGHGTSCAGIAAGNGNNSEGRYKGVAPDAELIAVRLGDDLDNAYLLNAICHWLDQVAGKTPVVVSCSFGGRSGAHDGSNIEQRQLDLRFASETVGRALCVAVGNDGGAGLHGQVEFAGSDHRGSLRWSTPASMHIEVYYSSGDDKDLRYVAPPTIEESGAVNPLLGTYVSYFDVPAGDGEIQFYTQSAKTVTADAYITGSVSNAHFDPTCAIDAGVVTTPGDAEQAITIGSYDWNDQFEGFGAWQSFTDPQKNEPLVIGGLSRYSSTGPLRTSKVVKPDIVAPGEYYAAPAARNTRTLRDTSGEYDVFNGTSASTPYTAGIVALVMQKKPSITVGQLKQLLHTCATQDRFTGPVPNSRWGYGKLDRKAVEKMMSQLD
ncbi:MAG TPA: S8 family serine peptidase [Pirellulales bacterium]|nr:S8 family serine peptidase [Pirellulales bacterium]